MLTVTDNACAHLAELLSDAPDESVIRLVPAENGLALQLGAVEPGDTTFEHKENTVLAMDEVVSTALAERTLDIESTEQGAQLSLS